jgi:LmbE family N-acetylglucosaminyl deacetylase
MKDLCLAKKNGRGLVVVAHPDDETIWMGGTLLRYPKIHWTILVLCRRHDSDRYPKFLKVGKFYRAKALITDLEDEGILNVKKSLPEIEQRINRLLKVKKFDYLLTHGNIGEYGHLRHIGVHQAVRKLIKEKKLVGEQIFYFAYRGYNKGDNSKASNDFKRAKYVLKLTPKEIAQKRKIVREMYGFTKKSFEYLSCSKKETFY